MTDLTKVLLAIFLIALVVALVAQTYAVGYVQGVRSCGGSKDHKRMAPKRALSLARAATSN